MAIQTQAESFLSHKRIAVVGVSRKQGTGNGIFKALLKRGHAVLPVNPNTKEVEGATCYPDLKSIPEGVEAAVIVTSPETAEKVMQDCVEAGVSHVWMHYNALFGARSSSVSDAATEYGREHGVDVIAGGCPLMFGEGADPGHRFMCWLLRLFHKLPQ
jgi:predicted CoA-binding protein